VPKKLAYRSPTTALIDADGNPVYSLCYPEGADANTMAALSALRDAIRTATGVNLTLHSDFIAEDEETDSYEILVGATNRAASVAAGGKLTYDSYHIGTDGNKLVIAAQNSFMLQKATAAFISLFLESEDTQPEAFALPVSFSYTHTEALLQLANNGKSDYTLIYPAAIDEKSLAYVKEFLQAFQYLTGASIPAYSDAELPYSTLEGGSREILVGATNRPGAVPTAGAGILLCENSHIKVLASDANNLRHALLALYDKILTAAKAQNAVDENQYNVKYPLVSLDRFATVTTTNAPGIPQFTDLINIGESAYMLYRDAATINDYESYLIKLDQLGYTLHDRGTAASLSYATFYSDDEILNITFTTADNMLRVTVDPRSEAALQPLTAAFHNGKNDVEPLFIQLGGMDTLYQTADCGMSYIVRLTDGTFLVVDGGVGTDKIAEDLYDTLKQYNVLGGKPVIACWIFTHAHSDHIGAFRSFTNEYFDKVTLQSVMYSFPTEEQSLIHGGSWVVSAQQSFRNYITEYGRGIPVYKARTGQHYQFAGCKLEMLFTFEDYTQPKQLTYFNDSSIVFRITLTDTESNTQSFMMLGDCSESSAPILVARYGSYLQSDAVQVAHHGYAGGTAALYDAISAAVVFWPCPLYAPKDNSKRFNNPKWSKVTRVMLGQDYAEVLYVAGLGDTVLTVAQVKDREILGIGMVAADAKYPS